MFRLVLVLTLLGTLGAKAAVETRSFESKKIRRLSLRDTSGKVRVFGDASAAATVASEKIEFGPNCRMKIEQEGQDLTVVVEEKSLFEKTSCRVNFEIHVPSETEIFAKLGAGKLSFQKTTGPLDFKAGAADVEIFGGTVAKLEGVLGSGKLDAQGLTGAASLKSGSGPLNLTYAKSPAEGVLDIKTGSSKMQLNFPKESAFSTNYTAGSGHLVNEFEETASAPFKIQVKAGTGDLKISKLKN